MIELILGGARSGKSRYAEERALALCDTPVYLATAEALDEEMAARIERHQQGRDQRWRNIESPLELANSLVQFAEGTVLVDCLTLWLSNCLHKSDVYWQQEKTALIERLASLPAELNLLLVSNEVGQGIVPIDPLSRKFVDECGWLHQEIAAIADRVTVVQAGIATAIKS